MLNKKAEPKDINNLFVEVNDTNCHTFIEKVASLLCIVAQSVNPHTAKDEIMLLLYACWLLKVTNKNHIAYILATVHHESAMGKWLIEFASGQNYEPVFAQNEAGHAVLGKELIDAKPIHSLLVKILLHEILLDADFLNINKIKTKIAELEKHGITKSQFEQLAHTENEQIIFRQLIQISQLDEAAPIIITETEQANWLEFKKQLNLFWQPATLQIALNNIYQFYHSLRIIDEPLNKALADLKSLANMQTEQVKQVILNLASAISTLNGRIRRANMLGNTEKGDGPRYKGRGFVQITGRANYTNYTSNQQNCLNLLWQRVPCATTPPETIDRIAANYFQAYKGDAKKFPCPLSEKPEPVDLIHKPELAQNPLISAAITVDGMLHGRFRNKKLSDFDRPDQPNQPPNRYDFFAARDMINGDMNRVLTKEQTTIGEKIAGHARDYLNVLLTI